MNAAQELQTLAEGFRDVSRLAEAEAVVLGTIWKCADADEYTRRLFQLSAEVNRIAERLLVVSQGAQTGV